MYIDALLIGALILPLSRSLSRHERVSWGFNLKETYHFVQRNREIDCPNPPSHLSLQPEALTNQLISRVIPDDHHSKLQHRSLYFITNVQGMPSVAVGSDWLHRP